MTGDAGAPRAALRQAAAASTELVSATAAHDALADGGTALDAVVAGFFAAAGLRPGALLAPVQILVAGPGVGARAFDGRPRQPGLGAKRPRGVREGDPVPPAARAAVPAGLAAIALALGHDGTLSFSRLARAGVEVARGRGAPLRAEALAVVGRLGAAAVTDAALARPLLAAAGPVEGGLLAAADLEALRPTTESPRAVACGAGAVLVPPWRADAPSTPRAVDVAVAGDHRGVLAALAWSADDDGLRVPELELVAPRDAELVRRGVPRLAPGTPLGAGATIAIALDGAVPIFALGAGAVGTWDDAAVERAWRELAPAAVALGDLATSLGGVACAGVVRSPRTAEMTSLSVPRRVE